MNKKIKILSKNIISVLVLILVVLFFHQNTFSQTSEEILIGGRQMAMGEAGIGEAFDANAIFWNPAGLVQLNGQMLSTMHQNVYGVEGTTFDYISFIKAKQKSSATGFYLSRTNFSGALDFTWIEDTLMFSYAGTADSTNTLFYGINFKYLRTRIPDTTSGSGNGFGVDLGLLYKLSDKIKIGITARNPFTTIKYATNTNETRNPVYTLGFSYKYNPVTTFICDLNDLVPQKPLGNFTTRFGLERWLDEAIALRIGYIMSDEENTSKFTAGVGLNLGPWKIDYAYDPPKGFTTKTPQRISVIYQLRY